MESSLDRWLKLMKIGTVLQCHQLPERSFFWKKYQFPVCARCLGMLIGHLLAIIILLFYKFSLILAVIFCLITFIDWFLQYLGILESTNWRRLITGILGGIGIVVLPVRIMSLLFIWAIGVY